MTPDFGQVRRRGPHTIAGGRWAWLPLAVLGTLACQSGKDEVVVTSVRLAVGDFKSLVWGGAQVERFHVVARRGADNEVVIWSPDQQKTCSLGAVAWYDTTQPLRTGGPAWGALGKGLVPFIVALDDQGRGTLRFAGIDCAPLPFELDDVKPAELWTAYDASFVKPTYVARTSDHRLIFADPWLGTMHEVTHDVTAVIPLEQRLWAVEGGQAVLREATGKESARAGDGVKELLILGEQEIAYVDASGLFHFSANKGKKRLASDVCSLRTLGGFPPGTLAYFSPCMSRRLVIDDGKGGTRVVAEGVVDAEADGGALLYTIKGESSTALWVIGSHGSGARVAELDAFELDRVWKRSSAHFLASVRQAGGAFALFTIDTAQHRAAQLVGDLASIRPIDDALATLGTDAQSTLRLLRLRDLRVERLATGVARASIRSLFGESLPALGYLTGVDASTGLGHLHLHFIESGADFPVADGVRELHEVWWPETGVVYSTGPGNDEGLWFARVAVPCDKTANTPWACAL